MLAPALGALSQIIALSAPFWTNQPGAMIYNL
jgi:hypothetical protein